MFINIKHASVKLSGIRVKSVFDAYGSERVKCMA